MTKTHDQEIFTAHWYPWFVRDVLTCERVDNLSLAEEGAYRRALDKAWLAGSIPADPKELAAVIGQRCTIKIARVVLSLFVKMPGQPRRMINLKLERVRDEQREKYLKKVNAGRARAAQRAAETVSKNGHASSTAQASLEHRSSEQNRTEQNRLSKERERASPRASPQALKRGTRCPEPFILTPEMRDYAATKRPDIDATLETERFCNYWRAKPGKDGLKLDWLATWRNWILNSRAVIASRFETTRSEPVDEWAFQKALMTHNER